MYAVSKEDLIKKILGSSVPETIPRLDIPADWDPDVIREITTKRDEMGITILGHIKAYVVPGILIIALLAQLSGYSMVNQVCMGIFSGLAVVSLFGAIMDRFFLDRNERAGNYLRVARYVYRAGSSYWKYKDFNEDISVSFKPGMYIAFLVAATISLGWYLGLAFLVLTTVVNGYVIYMRDSKARALIRYKEAWDTQVELDQQAAIARAEENAKKEEEIQKILLESGGEAPEPAVDANAVDAYGPVYVPEDMPDETDLATYNQRVTRIEPTADPEKYPDDHLDD